mmetsp:Transcript_48750/g.116042  ORF Transcript_48750/g.116042 Transcript_48750/m.116042 type:complete len:239 (-) Transcript_48750:243-959(-)
MPPPRVRVVTMRYARSRNVGLSVRRRIRQGERHVPVERMVVHLHHHDHCRVWRHRAAHTSREVHRGYVVLHGDCDPIADHCRPRQPHAVFATRVLGVARDGEGKVPRKHARNRRRHHPAMVPEKKTPQESHPQTEGDGPVRAEARVQHLQAGDLARGRRLCEHVSQDREDCCEDKGHRHAGRQCGFQPLGCQPRHHATWNQRRQASEHERRTLLRDTQSIVLFGARTIANPLLARALC